MSDSGPRMVGAEDDPATVLASAPTIAGYEILGLLSHGADLDVFDAWSHRRRSRVVLKVLRADRADDEAARARIDFEASLLLRLSHPHIVRAYEQGDEPRPFLVAETLTGATLGALIERQGRLGASELLYMADHLSSALAYLHDEGVLHLDLKPSNIVAEGGKLKLIDFSIAHAPGHGPAGWGTDRYLSPEQVHGGWYGPATDVWGFGVVLHEAATGQCPLEDLPTGSAARVGVTRRCDHAALRRRRSIPHPMRDLIERCLEPEPDMRPGLAEIRTVLDECLAA